MNGAYEGYVGLAFYDIDKRFISIPLDDYTGVNNGDYMFEFITPSNAAFVRVSTNYYNNPVVDVKISVEKGTTENVGHYPAPEDLQ